MAQKQYRIVGVYDSETTNITNNVLDHQAYPILHQLGILDDRFSIIDITPENVESRIQMHLFRHSIELYEFLDELITIEHDYVPVICCHNLSFDMYGLSPWLENKRVRVLAKSKRKPITFTIQDEHKHNVLVFWDTLVFSGQSLARMGRDCGYNKAVGEWNYDLIRTPETPLTPDEIDYATKDVYALFVWLAWWLKRNPDIEPEKLGLNVVTKTGIVRERRKRRFDQVKGEHNKQNIGRYHMYVNRMQAPKTDDELFTMMACTRGGFTFCASKSAGIPFDCRNSNEIIVAYDATSQHPAQMVSHRYPVYFHLSSAKALNSAFNLIKRVTIDKILDSWADPFGVAFLAAFHFTNLRLKKGSLFERNGIAPLASARFHQNKEFNEDNQQNTEFNNELFNLGYHDSANNPVFEFGKLVSASSCTLFITELTAFEIVQAYDFDSVEAIGGYLTTRFIKPTDMAVVSVMNFYKAKNEFKHARETYYRKSTIDNAEKLKELGIAPAIVNEMVSGTISDNDIDNAYLSLKADLNALFGIEASNEYRRDTVLTSNGIEYEGNFGICNAPKNPKTWYQFGQRIVGWSRIAQIVVMTLADPYCKRIINGDTDSVKMLAKKNNLPKIDKELTRFAESLDIAKRDICKRVKYSYPIYYDSLKGIGHYVKEFESECFCASWNKAYCTYDIDTRTNKRVFHFTLAGIPARIGVDLAANQLADKGKTFHQIASLMLGYNVMYSYSVIKINARSFPEWGWIFSDRITDYKGNTANVTEPAALALYSMDKIINDTDNIENYHNMLIAKANNPDINTARMICFRNDSGFIFVKAGEFNEPLL